MKSIFGLEQNIVAALAYFFGPFSGIVVLVLEKSNKFVRFHALQSTLWFLLLMVLTWVLRLLRDIPILGFVLGIAISPVLWVLSVVSFLSWVFLMYKAFTGATTKIPIIGDVVWSQVDK